MTIISQCRQKHNPRSKMHFRCLMNTDQDSHRIITTYIIPTLPVLPDQLDKFCEL